MHALSTSEEAASALVPLQTRPWTAETPSTGRSQQAATRLRPERRTDTAVIYPMTLLRSSLRAVHKVRQSLQKRTRGQTDQDTQTPPFRRDDADSSRGSEAVWNWLTGLQRVRVLMRQATGSAALLTDARQRDVPPRAPDRSTSRCLMPGSNTH